MKEMKATLLFLKKDDEILLARKKRGLGEGKLNGVGGKLENNESFLDAVIRECQEEISVTPLNPIDMGELRFLEYVKGEYTQMIIHVFIATSWEGEPKESEEVAPCWFSISSIPYDAMFEDDSYWLPYILEGKKIDCDFEFDAEWNLIKHEVTIQK